MSSSHDEPTLDDVMDVHEPTVIHRRDHAKASPRPDDDELQSKVDIEIEDIESDEESGNPR